MENPNIDQFSDEFWQNIAKTEERQSIERDAGYVLVEEYNAAIVRQVAGLEDLNLRYIGPLSGSEDDSPNKPPKLGPPTFARLLLRPDRQDALLEQGEPPLQALSEGSPYRVEGEIPDKTREVIGRLLGSIEAVYDAKASSNNEHVWRGNVASQPITIQQISYSKLVILDDIETTSVVTCMSVYRDTEPISISANEPRIGKILEWIKKTKKQK